MTISLQDFAAGDTNYVAKLNSNSDVLEIAIGALQALTSGAAFSAISLSTAYAALFGTGVALIGDESYVCTDAGSDNLNVAAGYCYKPSLGSVVNKGTASTLVFTGQPADTYYIVIDSTGEPTRGTTSTEAVYSVVWTGSVFGAITRLASIAWGAQDWTAAQTSTALAATYTSLDDRLEAGETGSAAGLLARTWQTGRLSLSVATGSPSIITLTAVQANNTLLNFTGALTENATIVVPLGTNPRMWIVTNNTTGAFTLTVKGVTGSGVAVTQGGGAVLFQDSTNVVDAMAAAGSGTVSSVGLSMPAEFTVSGTPVTSSGTLAVDKATQAPNTVYAGPAAGSPTNDRPTFRALVSADLPAVSPSSFGSISSHYVLVGPAAGSPTDAVPTFRPLEQSDLPAQPYDVGGSYAAAPTASLVLARYPFPRTVVFPASLTLSRGVAGTAATAQTDFDILKNGVSFGTMRFAIAATTATFISASGATFSAGDILTVVAPVSPDATLANIGFALAGTR